MTNPQDEKILTFNKSLKILKRPKESDNAFKIIWNFMLFSISIYSKFTFTIFYIYFPYSYTFSYYELRNFFFLKNEFFSCQNIQTYIQFQESNFVKDINVLMNRRNT